MGIEIEKTEQKPQETPEDRANKQWKEYLGHYEAGAQRMGGELRDYNIFDDQGKVKPNARRVKVFPMSRTDETNPSPAFTDDYVLRWMTTTQMGNMQDGKLINEGQEPRPDKADVLRLREDGVTLDSNTLYSVSYNPERQRWEMYPD
jgi:hypothetical protein